MISLARTDRVFVDLSTCQTIIRRSNFDDYWIDEDGEPLPQEQQDRYEAEYQKDHAE